MTKKLRDAEALARHNAQMKAYRAADPEKFRARSRRAGERHRQLNGESVANSRLVYRYGVSVEVYAEMLSQQNGVCAICSKPPSPKRRLGVDHNHTTGFVRALLCQNCNAGIGMFDENPDIIAKVLGYLSAFGGDAE